MIRLDHHQFETAAITPSSRRPSRAQRGQSISKEHHNKNNKSTMM